MANEFARTNMKDILPHYYRHLLIHFLTWTERSIIWCAVRLEQDLIYHYLERDIYTYIYLTNCMVSFSFRSSCRKTWCGKVRFSNDLSFVLLSLTYLGDALSLAAAGWWTSWEDDRCSLSLNLHSGVSVKVGEDQRPLTQLQPHWGCSAQLSYRYGS